MTSAVSDAALSTGETTPYVWDAGRQFWRNKDRADRVIRFIEALTIPSGVGAGKPFKLRPFQIRFIRDVYEPCDEAGRRIVREAVLSMARKNGKTALIAALVLVHLCGPEATMNGEIYSAANDKGQAALIYKFAAQLVRADPELDAEQGGILRCVDSTKHIVCHGNGSFYQALSRDMKTKHGFNPTMVIYDELAQALDRELFDVLNTSDSARDEFLFVVISTQSKDPQHILSELIDRGLAGDDPSVVCHLYTVPEEFTADFFCPKCQKRYLPDHDGGCSICGGDLLSCVFDESLWGLANPALNDFKLFHRMQEKARDAARMPSFLPAFLNLELNQRVDARPSIVSVSDWKACLDKECCLIEGEPVYAALDLSATTDLTALVLISATNGDRVAAWFWKPSELIQTHATRDRVPYARWVDEGYIELSPGRDIAYEIVATKLAELAATYKILGIAYDRWRMAIFIKELARLGISAYYDDDADKKDGLRFVPWGQGFKDMGPAVDALDKSVSSRSFLHAGTPVLTWCFANANASFDPAGNRKLDKSKARFRIDGAVATVMALGLKARDADQAEPDDLDDFLNNVISTGRK